jgi:hypothetical protein
MKPHFFKLSLFIFFISFIISCSKNADVVPNQIVMGTWKFQNTSGSAVVGGKTVDLAQTQDVGLSGQKLIFKTDGSGSIDGGAMTYTVSGNTLTITQSGVKLVMNVAVVEGVLTITADENGLKDGLAIQNALSPASGKITKLSQTLVYKSLDAIWAINGTPECVNTNFSYTTSTTKFNYTFNYDDERKVKDWVYTSTNLSTNSKTTFISVNQEVKVNLGSNTLPYVTTILGGYPTTKYYCDKNGRVNRVEDILTNNNKETFPYFSTYYEYNSEGLIVKKTIKGQDYLTGEFTGKNNFYEYEYVSGDLIKIFLTVYNGATITSPRYLQTEYTRTTNPIKTKTVYSYNYGTSSKNYVSSIKVFRSDGTVINTSSNNYTYTFDNKGYISTLVLSFLDGSKQTYDGYVYQCQ